MPLEAWVGEDAMMTSRKHNRGRGWLLAAGLLTTGSVATVAIAAPARKATIDRGLLLDGATVVDTTTGRLSPHRAIVIEDGKIVNIAAEGSITATGTAQRIDARGKFAVPGFLDMHAHPLNPSPDVANKLDLMLANGITGFRQMSGLAEQLEQRRKAPLTSVDQPSLLWMPGEILTHANAPTPEAAVAEIDRQKAQGADFIKMVDVSPSTFFAAMAESTRQRLTMVGHLPANVDVRKASMAGFHSIEHLGPQDNLLIACSSNEAALRAEMLTKSPPPPKISGPVPPALIERVLANPMVFTGEPVFERFGEIVPSYDAAKCHALAALFRKNQTWQVPTLIRVRTMEFGDDPQYVRDSHLQYVSPKTRALWASVSQQFGKVISPKSRATINGWWGLQLKLVKLFEHDGVPMLAGSDLGGQWVIPGFSLHQEFDLLASAGLKPLTVLQMTTLNGARFLHREADMGSIAPGKVGDIVLLDANPVVRIANLHRIFGLVHNDKYRGRADLDAIESRVASANR